MLRFRMTRMPKGIIAALVLFATVVPDYGGLMPRSVSTSRQFIVYASDARLRGAICDVAERTKQSALQLLQEQDAWKTPILINAQLPQANLPETRGAQLSISQTGFGLKLQLDLNIDADVSAPAIERELLRALFLEMMYRATPNTAAGTAYVDPPDWLLDGALAFAPGHDLARVADLLATPVASGAVISLPDFLRQRPDLLDSPSRALYRAYSAALVSALTDTPAGRRRLARFVADAPAAGNDAMADLQAHFPALGDTPEKIQKQWTLAIARLTTTDRFRLLTCEESERELARVLRVELRERDQPVTAYTLEEFPKFVRVAASAAALNYLRQELLLLSGRANPLYHPVIGEYEKIAALLIHGKTKNMTARLAELRATREGITRRMNAIGDYMNWYEATQSRSASGAFGDYMKAAELAAEREYHRRDAISVYLDAIESQF